jgi:hypothetical protein
MKLAGKPINKPAPEVVVIPRREGDLVFKCGVVDLSRFESIVKEPEAPVITYKDGTTARDVTDTQYQAAVTAYAETRMSWIVVESLRATEGLEWDSVTSDPSTWKNYSADLKAAGFSDTEIVALINATIDANGLSNKRIEEATKRFLAGVGRV